MTTTSAGGHWALASSELRLGKILIGRAQFCNGNALSELLNRDWVRAVSHFHGSALSAQRAKNRDCALALFNATTLLALLSTSWLRLGSCNFSWRLFERAVIGLVFCFCRTTLFLWATRAMAMAMAMAMVNHGWTTSAFFVAARASRNY